MPAQTLTFDIETVSDWENMSESLRSLMTARNTRLDLTRAPWLRELPTNDPQRGGGLSPLTGRIVSIALYDPDANRGVVYYEGRDDSLPAVASPFRYEPCAGEADILRAFWSTLERNEGVRLIGFNSRRFDAPFIEARTVKHELEGIRKLNPYKWSIAEHVDLRVVLNAYEGDWVPNLAAVAEWLGIPTPKNDLDGSQVQGAYDAGEIERIARYNGADALCTARVWQKWSASFQEVYTDKRRWG